MIDKFSIAFGVSLLNTADELEQKAKHSAHTNTVLINKTKNS